MSIDAFFCFRVCSYEHEIPVSAEKVIRLLARHSWLFVRDGYVSYFPIGDDDFNWTSEKGSLDSLLENISSKEERGELAGTFMTWQNSDIGGDLLIRKEMPDQQIPDMPVLFSISSDRQTRISPQNFILTDVNWYLEKLIPAFTTETTYVEAFSFDQY